MLFDEGDAGDAFFIVFSGAVEILKRAPGGGYERLAVKRPGEAFGEMALLNDAPRSAGARTAEDTQLIVVGQDEFLTMLGGDTLSIRLLQAFSKALRSLNIRFAAMERTIEITTGDPNEASRTIQRAMLPAGAPDVPGYDAAGGTLLVDSGDGSTVWDVVPIGGGSALAVLEVKEGPLPPGHVLGVARAALHASAGDGSVNAMLSGATRVLDGLLTGSGDQFVDCGVVLATGEGVRWGCAGRTQAAVLRAGGEVEILKSQGPSLGLMGRFSYDSEPLEMGEGDALLVLSGGSEGLLKGAADLVAKIGDQPASEVVSLVQGAIGQSDEVVDREVSAVYLRKQ
jgi:hypothetical protein